MGNVSKSSAAAAETCGVAIEVPSNERKPVGSQSAHWPVGTVDVIETPGATTSSSEPSFEKAVLPSVSVTAPTAITLEPHAGAAMALVNPLLPVAATTTTPASTARLLAIAVGSLSQLPGNAPPPRLIEITSAPFATHQSIPAITSSANPEPPAPSTFAAINDAP